MGGGLTGNVHELGATFVWLGGSRLHSLVTQSLDVVNVPFPHLSSPMVIEKVTGPNCFVTVPGTHVGPGRKFLTTTFSPIENSR